MRMINYEVRRRKKLKIIFDNIKTNKSASSQAIGNKSA